jgi:hypothetical protein
MLKPSIFAALCLLSLSASAIEFNLPFGEGDGISGVLNTTTVVGGQMRMQGRSVDLVGKANLDPRVCGRLPNGNPRYQICQGLFRDQSYPAARLSEVPGQYSLNNDDGNLNYDKHDITSALFKVTQDLKLEYGNYGFFARNIFFYDHINENFTEFHPNRITRENLQRVGVVANAATNGGVPRNDSTPCPASRNPGGLPCGLLFGPGEVVRNARTDPFALSAVGSDLQYLDAYFFGKQEVLGREVTVKLGRQTVNWGESTALVIGSINSANPLNANNFYRIGSALEEVFTPINMAFVSFSPTDGLNLEGFYQLEWRNTEGPPVGSFYSTQDLSTNNNGSFAVISTGAAAEDPEGVGILVDNPLSGLTNTSLRALRLPDLEPKTSGQFGLSAKYFAEWLNGGTELGLFYMNYHSRLPYASFFATRASCARREGNALGIDANSSATFAATCNDIPTLRAARDPNNPAAATSDAVPFDDLRLMLEYPENIQMLGVSFNTTFGDYSFQGEVAYRPNQPLQVATADLAFAAFGPTLTRCHDRAIACTGATVGLGTDVNGNTITYQNSNFLAAPGQPGAFADTFDLAIGHATGSARSFPSFVIPYRGGVVGENAPTDFNRPFDRNNPGYIRGFERMSVFQFDLGTTRVIGATDNFIGADQVILLGEAGAVWIPDLPSLDQLQIEGPGANLHASAGADGTGADRSRQACSSNPSCSFGPDGLRFNPHQQDRKAYVTKVSAGYRAIAIIRYESVLPGISIQPLMIWSHDVYGTSPGPGENFVEGRKSLDTTIETRYKSAFSFNLGYQWFFGGGVRNLLADRDNLRVFMKYQF